MITNEQILSMLTEEEKNDGYFCVETKVGVDSRIYISENVMQDILDRTPYAEYVIGLERDRNDLKLVLNEEGKAEVRADIKRMEEFFKRWGTD